MGSSLVCPLAIPGETRGPHRAQDVLDRVETERLVDSYTREPVTAF